MIFLYSITFGQDKKYPDWFLYRLNMTIIIKFIYLLFSFRLYQTFEAQGKTIKKNDKVTRITDMFLVEQASLLK